MNRDETPINGRQGAAYETVRWPFERALWLLQRGLFWPLQDRLALLGPAGRATAGVATGVLALAAAAIGIGLAGGSGGTATSSPVAQAPVAAPVAEQVATPEPTLEGAAPVFREKSEKNSPKSAPAKSEDSSGAEAESTGSGSAATDTISSSPAANDNATASSSTSSPTSDQTDGRPAGPKAVAVANRFAAAFVVYETGGDEPRVREAFAKTATRELSRSLLRRPPRLPENVAVPKAKVVNVVSGPSHDGIYPVSVSLLRVGLTSELRLDMERLKGRGWRVTNVLG